VAVQRRDAKGKTAGRPFVAFVTSMLRTNTAD
jgi:hypothetical protein